MDADLIFGLPAMNFQAIFGLLLFGVTVFLVKVIRGIQMGRYPGSVAMIFYLRTLLWCTLIGSVVLFFGAIFGFRYV